MPEQKYTMKEIQERVSKLNSSQSIVWSQIWNDIGHDKEDNPYKKMSLEYMESVRSRIVVFMSHSEQRREYGLLLDIIQHVTNHQLNPADKEILKQVLFDMQNIEARFKEAEKEEAKIRELYEEKIKDIADPVYPKYNALPRNISIYTINSILRRIETVAIEKPKIDLKPLAGLALYMYGAASAGDKTKVFAKLKSITDDPDKKHLLKAMRASLETTLAKKIFTDEDKTVLRDLIERKSWFAKIFRKSTAQIKQQAVSKTTSSQGRNR